MFGSATLQAVMTGGRLPQLVFIEQILTNVGAVKACPRIRENWL